MFDRVPEGIFYITRKGDKVQPLSLKVKYNFADIVVEVCGLGGNLGGVTPQRMLCHMGKVYNLMQSLKLFE